MSPESNASRARRAYGSGSIYELKAGRNAGMWRGQITVHGQRRTCLGKSYAEVEAKLDELRRRPAPRKPRQPAAARKITAAERINALFEAEAEAKRASSGKRTPAKRTRDYRDGALYQIKSGPSAGKWKCQIRTPGGPHQTRSFTGTREEAEAKLLEFKSAIVNNTPLPPSRQRRVGEYMTSWLDGEWLDGQGDISYSTHKDWDWAIRRHIVPCLGSVFLADFNRDHMTKLFRHCKAKNLSKHSVVNIRTPLNKAFARAEEEHLVQKNWVRVVRVPREWDGDKEPFQPKPWTEAEAYKFLDEVANDPDETLYTMTLALALRRGEAVGLRWSDIDWKNQRITIAGQGQRQTGKGVIWKKTKGKTADVMDVPDEVLDLLLKHQDRHVNVRPHPSNYVFTNAQGDPYDPDKFTKDFPKWLTAHGLRRIRVHDLRHTAATMQLALGVPDFQVAKWLRHKSPAMVRKVYGHYLPETSRKNADLVGAWMSRKVSVRDVVVGS